MLKTVYRSCLHLIRDCDSFTTRVLYICIYFLKINIWAASPYCSHGLAPLWFACEGANGQLPLWGKSRWESQGSKVEAKIKQGSRAEWWVEIFLERRRGGGLVGTGFLRWRAWVTIPTASDITAALSEEETQQSVLHRQWIGGGRKTNYTSALPSRLVAHRQSRALFLLIQEARCRGV